MSMKKYVKSDVPVVIGNGKESELYPPGYRYMVGDETFTVIRKFSDSSIQWRRLRRDDGREEEVTVQMIKDDHDMETNGGRDVTILDPDPRVPRE